MHIERLSIRVTIRSTMRGTAPVTVTLILRVATVGAELGTAAIAETDPHGMRRLLIYRLTVLEAALRRVAEIQREAAQAPIQ